MTEQEKELEVLKHNRDVYYKLYNHIDNSVLRQKQLGEIQKHYFILWKKANDTLKNKCQLLGVPFKESCREDLLLNRKVVS